MKIINKIISCGFYLFVFFLPWQTRWIFKEAELNDGVWEYGRLSLYGSQIILLGIFLLGLVVWFNDFRQKKIQERLKEFRRQPLIILILAIFLIIWTLVITFWAADKILAYAGLINLLFGLMIFWLFFSQSLKSRLVNLSLILSGLIQSLIGFWQFINQSSVANKWLGLSYFDSSTLGASVIETGTARILRAYGSLPHPNILGGFLAICFFICLLQIITEKKKCWLSFYYGAIAILAMGLFFTFSRSAWLALGISLVFYVIYLLIKKISYKNILIPIVISGLVFISLGIIFSDLLKTRLESSSRLEVKSNQERIGSYYQAWPLVKENWLQGAGLENYTFALYQKNPGLFAWDYQPVHNVWLLVLFESGIIGLLLYLGIIFLSFKNKSQYWPLLIIIIVLGLFDHYLFSLYFGIMLFWLVVGLNSQREQ